MIKIKAESKNFIPHIKHACRIKSQIIICDGHHKVHLKCNQFFTLEEKFRVSGLVTSDCGSFKYDKWIVIDNYVHGIIIPKSNILEIKKKKNKTNDTVEDLIWFGTLLPRNSQTNKALGILINSMDKIQLVQRADNLNEIIGSIILLSRIVIHLIDDGDKLDAAFFYKHLSEKYGGPRYLLNYPDFSFMILKMIKSGILKNKLEPKVYTHSFVDSQGDQFVYQKNEPNVDYSEGIGFALRETTPKNIKHYIKDKMITSQQATEIKELRDSLIHLLPKNEIDIYKRFGWISDDKHYDIDSILYNCLFYIMNLLN